MVISITTLFGHPQSEVATLIRDRISRSTSTSIVTGFATPGGIRAIGAPLRAHPDKLSAFIVGAATYPGFEAMDELLTAGVPTDRLFVHLGHSFATGTPKNPFARYHPMLHSKIYLMEMPAGKTCAFVGSHNVTSFALAGLNGEAAIMLEGDSSSAQFGDIRLHIQEARLQSVKYSANMKEAYAWWWREYVDGLKAETRLPQDWVTVRTVMIFCEGDSSNQPSPGDVFYFELPEGIEQIESLKTEVHLFLFSSLPPDPWTALQRSSTSYVRFKGTTLGVDNRQGNAEIRTDWRINTSPTVKLEPVVGGTLRPGTPPGLQQVRAEISSHELHDFEYQFERERGGWEPHYSGDSPVKLLAEDLDDVALLEANGNRRLNPGWRLVTGLSPRSETAVEQDQEALRLAAPESGSFVLVSLRRRRRT